MPSAKPLTRWTVALGMIVALGGCAAHSSSRIETASPPDAVVEPRASPSGPRNVILLIGDGMGFEQVKAASLFAAGSNGKLTMQQMPVSGRMTTHPAGGEGVVTDSAAAGTAVATGVKVTNRVVSLRTPGDGGRLETLLERLGRAGKRTGLVTTTYMTHATPASFGAHVADRGDLAEIARQYVTESRPNVLLGGGGKGMSPELARSNGYVVVTTRRELEHLDPAEVEFVSGQFGEGHMPYEFEDAMRIDGGYDRLPHLTEMTRAALAILEQDDRGFFLMIEGGRIDHAGHANYLKANILETLEFDAAVREVLRWAKGRDDTLVVVTADHECGGLHVGPSAGRASWPEATWGSTGHTGAAVPLYAWGVGAERFAGQLDNVDLKEIILSLPETAGEETPEPWGAAAH